jgi:hypothetical protein
MDSFDPLEDGWYILKTTSADSKLDANGGLKAKAESVVEGGSFDGRKHFENFSTKTNAGDENPVGIKALVAFLIKTGMRKQDQIEGMDSSKLETPEFVKWFNSNAINKSYGAYLQGEITAKGNTMTKTKKYRTAEEAKKEMVGPSVPSATKEPAKSQPQTAPRQTRSADEGWD